MENNLLKSIVYITINTINNKIYIGVHITENPYKFDNYYGCGITGTSCYQFKHPKTLFQKACKKYGLDAFKRYTLYVFDSYEEALAKEREIVNEDFLKRPDVYNTALGGGSGLIPKTEIAVYQYDLNGNFLTSYRSYSDAGRKNNVSYTSIISAVETKGICCNTYWSEVKKVKLNISKYKKNSKVPVYLYKHTGEFYKEFESMSDCATFLEVCLSGIQKAIKFGTKCNKYYISLEKKDKIIIKQYKRNTNKPVFQYSETGEFIEAFNSIKDARIKLNKKLDKLSHHILDNTLYEGYYWTYEKVDKIEVKIPVKKKIEQWDLNGNLIKIWDSYRECVKEFSNLRYVLNGSRASTKGFFFKYVS